MEPVVNDHKVSIIVPVYNTDLNALTRSIGSAVKQSGAIEVLVVDDGSEIECSRFLDLLAMRYSGLVKVLHKSNGGVSSARNMALEKATGDIVAFLDADDELNPSFVETALSILSQKHADVVLGGMTYCFTSGKQVRFGNPDLCDNVSVFENEKIEILIGSIFNKEAMRRDGLSPAMYVSNCAALYRKSAIGQVRFKEDLVISEDRVFNYEVFRNCSRIAITGQSWYKYFENPESASQQMRENAKAELIATATAYEKLTEDCPEAVKDDIYRGIVECFMQTLEFTILREGFKRKFKVSKAQFVNELLSVGVYQRAFSSFQPHRTKEWVLKRLFEQRRPATIAAMYKLNRIIFDLKRGGVNRK